jgi:RHS repeat-associated protein
MLDGVEGWEPVRSEHVDTGVEVSAEWETGLSTDVTASLETQSGGTMFVATGGDFLITIVKVNPTDCRCQKLALNLPWSEPLFGGQSVYERVGESESRYFPGDSYIRLRFKAFDGSCSTGCGHGQKVYSDDASNVEFVVEGPDRWLIKFEDTTMSCCLRDLWVRVQRVNTLVPPAWVDTGPVCTSGAERTLTWETTAGWWYRVQRATDPNFVQDVVSVDVLAAGGSASHTFTGHGTGTYYYRVQSRGRTNTDASGWTTAQAGHDRSGPGVTHNLSGTQANGWYRSAVQVSLAAADVGCDGTVAGIEQAVDGAAWQPYAGPFSLADPATHTVRYRASDGRGNVGPVGALEARLDLAGPGGWHDFGPSGWIAQLTSTVRVWGADALSGLDVGTAQVRVSVDEGASWGAWQPATCGGAAGTTSAQELSATVVLSEGVANRVQFRVWDRAGNVGESVAYAVRANRSAPVWGAMVAPVGWTGVLTPEVAVEVRDAEPGLDVGSVEYQYTTDGGQSWSAWQSATCTGGAGSTVTETVGATVPFGRGSVGASHRVRFRVLDGVGNVGQSEPYVVWVDGTGPEVWVAAPERAYGGRVVVAWGATDEQSGVGGRYDVAVRVDGGAWAPVLTDTTALTLAHAIEAGRRYDFRVATADNVGNVGRAEATVYTPRVTKYYHHGGQRVAQRVAVGVVYLHGDHLGSTSLTTDGGGAVVARQLYHPYGTVRWREGALPTDFTYTGQRAVAGTGLMDYRARYYHPTLGRFVSADTVVPEAGNPQDWNRYAFVRNNPLAYTDPTGHVPSPPYPMWPQRKKLAPKLVMRPVRLSHPDDTSGYSAPVMPTPTTMPMPTVTPAPMPESGVDWVSPLDDPIKYWNGYGYYDWGCNIDGSCGCAPYQQPEVEHPDYDCPLCFHNGWDMTSATTNVYAMGDGIVKSSSSANRLDISHVVNGVEIEVQYTHVQYDQEILSSGTAVQAGQLLGNWGAYGTGFGHFHWSVKVDGHVVDPKDYWPGSVPASFTGSWGDPICIPPNCP